MTFENIMLLITLTGFIPFIAGFITLVISTPLTGNEEKKANRIGWTLLIIGSLMMTSAPITAAIVHFTNTEQEESQNEDRNL